MVMIQCFTSRLYSWRRQMPTTCVAVTWAWTREHFSGLHMTASRRRALTFMRAGNISLIETSKNMVALKARPFWLPSEQVQPLHGPVVILWDMENCGVPSDVQPEDVAGNIRVALRSHPVTKGAVKRFSAYGDFNKFTPSLRDGCQKTGVTLVDVPTGRKDAADMAILVDMFQFALDNPPPSTIMLISGDVDFAPALHVLGQRGYTIVLVVPARNSVSSALINAGCFIWEWPNIVIVPSKASRASAMDSTKDAFTRQDKKATLSYNRSGLAGLGNYKHQIKVQPPEAVGLMALLMGSFSLVRVKSGYHNIIHWALHAFNYGVCKFANLVKSMRHVTVTALKGNLLFYDHFDQSDKADRTNMGRAETKDEEVFSDSVSFVARVCCLVDRMVARCSLGTDLLPSGNPHALNTMNNKAQSCANDFTRQRETGKRDCNGKEVVEKQNQEKKLKNSDKQLKFEEGHIASGPVEDEMTNTIPENEIRMREMASQTCSELQSGEGSKSKMETNNEGGKETSMHMLSSKVSLVSKMGQKETTAQSTWCKVCNINCFHEGVLYQHKQGKKHKRTLEKLHKMKIDNSATGPCPAKGIHEAYATVTKKN